MLSTDRRMMCGRQGSRQMGPACCLATTAGAVKLWDAATGTLIRTFEGRSSWVFSVARSPDGRRVLSGGWDHTLKLWDASSGALIRTLKGHTAAVRSVAFSPDGTRLLSGGDD